MNSSKTKNMTKGSISGLIISFALPIFLSNLFQQLYSTVDSLIVGKCLGTTAFTAVSSSGNLIYLFNSFFLGMSMGAGVVISKYFGSGDNDSVSKAIHTDFIISVICGILLTVGGAVFSPACLKLMNTLPEVFDEAVGYFRFYSFGAIAMVLYSCCTGIMTALGDSKRPLIYLIISSLLNVGLDLLFIAVFRWGVWSAALATAIAQAISVILCLIHLLEKGTIYQLQLSKMKITPSILLEIVKNGFPSAIQNSVIGLANVIVQTSVNDFALAEVAAFGAYNKISGFSFLPITSFAMALTTFISQNLGAKEYKRARKGSHFGVGAACILAALIGVIMIIFPEFCISIFDDSPEVVAFGKIQIYIEASFFIFLAFSHALAAVCRGSGHASVPMIVMLSVWCVFRVIYIKVTMTLWHNIVLIYWAYPITWVISSVLFLLYYIFSDWEHGHSHEAEKRIFKKKKA